MTNYTEPVLAFIQKDEPRSSDQIWSDIERLRGLGVKLDDLPPKVGELTNALFALMMQGRAKEVGGVWHVVRKPAKVERTLFS